MQKVISNYEECILLTIQGQQSSWSINLTVWARGGRLIAESSREVDSAARSFPLVLVLIIKSWEKNIKEYHTAFIHCEFVKKMYTGSGTERGTVWNRNSGVCSLSLEGVDVLCWRQSHNRLLPPESWLR